MARVRLLRRLLVDWLEALVVVLGPILLAKFGLDGITKDGLLFAAFMAAVLALFVIETEPLVTRRLRAFWQRRRDSH